jgi:2'-5' RNA ligase
VSRLFYALDLDDASRDAVALMLRRLAHDPPRGVRVLSIDVVHLTMKFLGETEDALVPALAEGLAALRPIGPSPSKELTGFPRPARAHVGVLELADPDGALAGLARALEERAVSLGLPAETRPFRPHVTLARARDGRDMRAWLARVTPPEEVRFASLTLYESRTLPTGPIYTARARVPLD